MLTWLDHRVSSTVFENYQKMRRLEKQQRCLFAGITYFYRNCKCLMRHFELFLYNVLKVKLTFGGN